jgi:hypothetical protein
MLKGAPQPPAPIVAHRVCCSRSVTRSESCTCGDGVTNLTNRLVRFGIECQGHLVVRSAPISCIARMVLRSDAAAGL